MVVARPHDSPRLTLFFQDFGPVLYGTEFTFPVPLITPKCPNRRSPSSSSGVHTQYPESIPRKPFGLFFHFPPFLTDFFRPSHSFPPSPRLASNFIFACAKDCTRVFSLSSTLFYRPPMPRCGKGSILLLEWTTSPPFPYFFPLCPPAMHSPRIFVFPPRFLCHRWGIALLGVSPGFRFFANLSASGPGRYRHFLFLCVLPPPSSFSTLVWNPLVPDFLCVLRREG